MPSPGSDSGARDTGSSAFEAPTSADGGSDGPSYTHTLIDEMETTTHGPIELAGITSPLTLGYWFNFGATVMTDTRAGLPTHR